jgi:hypothetical protein
MPPLGSNNNQNVPDDDVAEEEQEEVLDVESLNKLSTHYVVPTREEEKGELQKFMENDSKLKPAQKMIFVVMVASAALGFTVDEWEPYKTYMDINRQKKGQGWKSLNPTKQLVVMEIKRRNPQFKANIKNKSLTDLMNELQNTLTDSKDVDYICHMERRQRQNITAMINNLQDKTAPKEKPQQQTRHDRMRLICCFQDEDIVEAYRLSQEVMVRSQLDARNSEQRALDFYDLIVAKFNDSDWVPQSESDPGLHEDFAEQHEYAKRPEYTLDVEKTKKIFATMKGHITAVLRDYEKSGNGAVNADEMYQLGDEAPDEEITAHYGHFDLEKALTAGGDDRKNFLRGKPTDVLYWWKVLDELQVITLTCVAMKKELGADSNTRPISIAALNKQKKNRKRKSINESVATTATALQSRLEGIDATVKDLLSEGLKAERMNLLRQYHVTDKDAPEEYRAILKERIDEIDAKLKK